MTAPRPLARVDSELPADPGTHWLVRLWRRLSRPIWGEATRPSKQRRLRTLIGMPFAAIAGLAWGAVAGAALSGGPALWAPLGAVAFTLFLYLQLRLIGPLGDLVARVWPRGGGVAALVWESLAVGALFFAVTSVLGAPLVPAVGTALGLGAFYSVVVEYLVGGAAGADLALLVHGAASRAGARARPAYSYAEALVQQGRIGEAIAFYEEAIDDRPRDPEPSRRLAALLVRERRWDEAVTVLRSTLGVGQRTPEADGALVRRIFAICSDGLGDPRLAVPDLERLIERHRRSEEATWARWRLRELNAAAADGDATG